MDSDLGTALRPPNRHNPTRFVMLSKHVFNISQTDLIDISRSKWKCYFLYEIPFNPTINSRWSWILSDNPFIIQLCFHKSIVIEPIYKFYLPQIKIRFMQTFVVEFGLYPNIQDFNAFELLGCSVGNMECTMAEPQWNANISSKRERCL